MLYFVSRGLSVTNATSQCRALQHDGYVTDIFSLKQVLLRCPGPCDAFLAGVLSALSPAQCMLNGGRDKRAHWSKRARQRREPDAEVVRSPRSASMNTTRVKRQVHETPKHSGGCLVIREIFSLAFARQHLYQKDVHELDTFRVQQEELCAPILTGQARRGPHSSGRAERIHCCPGVLIVYVRGTVRSISATGTLATVWMFMDNGKIHVQ